MAFRTLRINDAGDIDLSGGRAHVIEDGEAIAQTVRSYLRTFRGEWMLNKLLGVPYWEEVLVKAPNVGLLESIFSKAILERPGVRSLEQLDLELLDSPARTLQVTFTASTKTGTISADVPLEVL